MNIPYIFYKCSIDIFNPSQIGGARFRYQDFSDLAKTDLQMAHEHADDSPLGKGWILPSKM